MKASSLSNPESSLHVVVLSERVEHVMAARQAALAWPLPAQIEWACSWHEAMRRARELPAHLVIVDVTDKSDERTALARHLQRLQPTLEVLCFIDSEAARAPSPGVWPWSALVLVLDEWLDLRRKLQALPA